MSSPTQRTLAEMRKRGFLCAVVEKFNSFTKTRNDLFGFIDILCIAEGSIIGVQATSDDNLSKRVVKINTHENIAAVRASGIKILVQGWRKKGNRWQVREVDCSIPNGGNGDV